MKIFKLLNNIPFLLTLIICTFLYINNQKEYTKLKLLIWSSPSLSLGTYISISAGTGYLLSYVFTTTLSKAHKSKSEQSIRYKPIDEDNKNNYYQQRSSEINYDNTLIERDIKDPAPTVKANFRVIGKSNRKIELTENDFNNEYDSPYNMNDLDSKYVGNNNNNDFNSISNDWDDDNFINW